MGLLDGRKARWFDCDWNNNTNVPNGCGQCSICKYNDFLDFAYSVGKPNGTSIDYDDKKDEYLKTTKAKTKLMLNIK